MNAELFPAASGAASRAVLFFAGWGMDATPFRASLPADRDCVVCFNYANLDFDLGPELARRYDEVLVVAWSLGVWAAARVLPRLALRVSRAVAVNGTMHPVDDERGIPRAVFAGTLAGLCPASLAKFHRRMCAASATHAAFRSAAPRRDFADVKAELAAIATATTETVAPAMRWDRAVVGTADRVFPPANQLRAWEGTRTATPADGHFLSSWKEILDGGAPA